jgi:predicted  nucleic acid-binding Zn-ribbon protein
MLLIASYFFYMCYQAELVFLIFGTTLVSWISSQIMAKYEEKRKDKNFPILSELSGKKCSACGMELSMKDIADLENGNIIECENCRLLVYKNK